MHAPLTSGQLTLLDHKLRARYDAIRRELAVHQQGDSRVDHAQDVLSQDNDDAPQRASERELDLARTEQLLRELSAIDAALDRIKRDSYGLCGDCRAPIAFARLSAEPWALRCIACQAKREQGAVSA
ncbi:MAG TPA: TraR/DksA family transcriptional regulator [Burkholderiaceae bacterium]|jgi:DnaK suppressor protein|nr:TraR/DksA family transcriptional regulator [Burkholderiaceae bacterium]